MMIFLPSLPPPEVQTISSSATTQSLDLIVNVPAGLPAGTRYFFTGGPETGCNWQPDCKELRVVDAAGLSMGTELLLPGDLKSIEYKITRGSWETEAASPTGEVLSNQVASLAGAQSIDVVSVVTWKDTGALGVTGTVVELGEVESSQLGASRKVAVWLPPSYATDPNKHYPVLYMHDGQNIFDPSKSAFGVDWGVDEAMTRIASSMGNEAIVVGISCAPVSKDRDREYDYKYKGAAYASYLIDTVKPMIDQKFRTLPARESTFTAGSSMGALIAVELTWMHPEVFSKALGFSLPAMVSKNSIIDLVKGKTTPKLPIQLYVDHGDWGNDSDYKQSVSSFVDAFNSRALTGSSVVYKEFPYADHSEVDWSRRLEAPLEWLLQ